MSNSSVVRPVRGRSPKMLWSVQQTGSELQLSNETLMIQRFQKCVDCVVVNYVDAGCDLPQNFRAESLELNRFTTNGCESYGHLNADFYSQPNINTLFVETLLRLHHLHYYSVTCAVAANSQEQQSPYFCDTCTSPTTVLFSKQHLKRVLFYVLCLSWRIF